MSKRFDRIFYGAVTALVTAETAFMVYILTTVNWAAFAEDVRFFLGQH